MSKNDLFVIGMAINGIAMSVNSEDLEKIKPYLKTIETTLIAGDKGWTSTSERLPEENGYYLVCIDGGFQVVAYFRGAEDFYFKDYVKAWMPLPEPYMTEAHI